MSLGNFNNESFINHLFTEDSWDIQSFWDTRPKGHSFYADHNATWYHSQMQDGEDWTHEAAKALSMQYECAPADPSPTARHA